MAITLDGTTGITTTDGDVYAEVNILGTVSQTSGVPTGSILEKGSNADGEYVKYADGTLICWKYAAGSVSATDASGSLFRSSSSTAWTFPVPFAVAPVCSGQAETTGFRWLLLDVPSTTSVSFRHASSVTSAGLVGTRLMAIGRWY